MNIVFYYKPGNKLHGKYDFNWKKRYIIDLCAVCNLSTKITYVFIGYLNAMYDTQVWGQTQIHQNLLSCLSSGKYLLGDEIYTSTSYKISPYKAFKAN